MGPEVDIAELKVGFSHITKALDRLAEAVEKLADLEPRVVQLEVLMKTMTDHIAQSKQASTARTLGIEQAILGAAVGALLTYIATKAV